MPRRHVLRGGDGYEMPCEKVMSYQSGAPVLAIAPEPEKASAKPPSSPAPAAAAAGGGGGPRASSSALATSLRRLLAAFSAVVLLSLSLAPESGTQTRWSDSSYWTVEQTDATAGTATSTAYAFRGDLYQGALSGVRTLKTAAGAVTTTADGYLSAFGPLWDMFTAAGCLSKALASDDRCAALSTLLGMSVFIRLLLVASLLALLAPLLRLGEALLLARWTGEENAADALVRAGGDELKAPALAALCCTLFCLVAWPSAVSGALGALRNGWRGGADISSTALLVRPGGGYFCVVGAAATALWLWRGGGGGGGIALPSLSGYGWGSSVAPWRKPAAERPDDLATAYGSM